MSALSRLIALGAALAVFILVPAATFTVGELEQVVITQFGRPVGVPVRDPGLHYRVPFIQKINRIDRRYLEWDGNPTQMPTRDKRFIWVDSYARWRITDATLYFQRLRDERAAQSRLDDILDGETRNAVARHDLIEIVRSTNRPREEVLIESQGEEAILEQIEKGRRAIAQEILDNTSARTLELGIELLDFRIKRIMYVSEVQQDVFERMISERRTAAESFRSQGAAESARINGERELELNSIRSEAFREAEELRGEADGQAARIYNDAFSRDPQFYAFVRSLQTYRSVIGSSSTLVLGTDGELLRFLKGPR